MTTSVPVVLMPLPLVEGGRGAQSTQPGKVSAVQPPSVNSAAVPVFSNSTWSPELPTVTEPGPTVLTSLQHPQGPRLHRLRHTHTQLMKVLPAPKVDGAMMVTPSKTFPSSKDAPGPIVPPLMY